MQRDALKQAMSTSETQYRSYQEAVKALQDIVVKRREQTKYSLLPLLLKCLQALLVQAVASCNTGCLQG